MKTVGPHKSFAIARAALAAFLLLTPADVSAEEGSTVAVNPAIAIGGQTFATWGDYYSSQYFKENGKRCGKPDSPEASAQFQVVDPSDCTSNFTNPSSDYVPGTVYQIPVVVHIIEHSNGDGQISDALVHSQIDVLNEDFRALAGTPGAGGYDSAIQFVLASTDPGGSPTTGITRTVNDNWFNDNGSYYNTLAWDTADYMNIYTNNAGGNLGYVPSLPQSGIAGSNQDRIVILWSAFGRNSSGGPPYDQGRTATHEVGHYLGLEHTFSGGCAAASSPACYSTGDLICDTNSEDSPTYSCPSSPSSCGSPDPVENYMDYSDDTCMELFSAEQSLRMRCSLLNYRADLWESAVPPVCGNNTTESGEDCDGSDAAACPTLCQIDCMCPAPVCGNNITESGEDCDGTSTGSCPTGTCDAGCVCPAPVCGNNITESGEDCDGSDDSACPGLCEVGCACPVTCNIGDLYVVRAKSDIKRFSWKAELANFSGTYNGADPRNQFLFYVVQGANSVTVDIPTLDPGWIKSKPEKGRFKWKGLLNGVKKVILIDKTLKKGIWKVRVVGKEVPGAELIDIIFQFADIEMTMDGLCGGGTY